MRVLEKLCSLMAAAFSLKSLRQITYGVCLSCTLISQTDHMYLPILCASGPKRLVPIRYEILAGRKAAPSVTNDVTL